MQGGFGKMVFVIGCTNNPEQMGMLIIVLFWVVSDFSIYVFIQYLCQVTLNFWVESDFNFKIIYNIFVK